jgi:hypothetical protein
MASSELPIPRDPTEDEALALFRAIEEKFPSSTLGDDKWYVLVVSGNVQLYTAAIDDIQYAAMVGGGQPGFAPLLYKELIKRPEYTSPEQRQGLMRRIRETLFKLIVIVGVCKPLEAIFDIDAITRPEDKDYTFSRYQLLYSRSKVPADEEVGKGGNATKRTPNAALHGRIACTSTTSKTSTTCWHHNETLVST